MSNYDRIWNVIKKIPYGRVATYGQIAALADLEGHARLVGYALHNVKPQQKLPWHRVINSQGKISLTGPTAKRQRKLLETEGVEFSLSGKISLRKFQWEPALSSTFKIL